MQSWTNQSSFLQHFNLIYFCLSIGCIHNILESITLKCVFQFYLEERSLHNCREDAFFEVHCEGKPKINVQYDKIYIGRIIRQQKPLRFTTVIYCWSVHINKASDGVTAYVYIHMFIYVTVSILDIVITHLYHCGMAIDSNLLCADREVVEQPNSSFLTMWKILSFTVSHTTVPTIEFSAALHHFICLRVLSV